MPPGQCMTGRAQVKGGIEMLTYIVGSAGKSVVARGLWLELTGKGHSVVIFHSDITGTRLDAALEKFDDVVVCWQGEVAPGLPAPDFCIDVKNQERA
jgi:hypothetical protein